MIERPIPFNATMSHAVRAGRKTQTRRIAAMFPADAARIVPSDGAPGLFDAVDAAGRIIKHSYLPKYCAGDQLWVREEHYRFGYWERAGVTKTGREKWAFVAAGNTPVQFDAPKSFLSSRAKSSPEMPRWYKRLARFMPKVLARTRLEVVSVRVERVNDISEEDAIAEGIDRVRGRDVPAAMGGGIETWRSYEDTNEWFVSAVSSFQSLWRSINGPDSLNENPWVLAITFKRVTT